MKVNQCFKSNDKPPSKGWVVYVRLPGAEPEAFIYKTKKERQEFISALCRHYPDHWGAPDYVLSVNCLRLDPILGLVENKKTRVQEKSKARKPVHSKRS